ncbi:MAG: hypothetical protein FWC96_05515 [Oscillospiraceae bacterium]|nr:hypothetical protein [Oscillospiraceae bacterium]
MTYGIREDGMPVYNESFKNGLLEFYGGVKGYIYTCNGDFEVDENTTIKHAVISKESVEIQDVDVVDDAYERILQYEKEGLLVITRYENLSEKQKAIDRHMLLDEIKELELLKGEHPLSEFVSAKFPEIWEEALNL